MAKAGRNGSKHPNWGGRRPGAGRKPKGEEAMVSHLRRPRIKPGQRVRIRWELRPGLESAEARRALAAALEDGRESPGFHVLSAALRGGAIHLEAEARSINRLARGLQGLGIRFARGLNRTAGRSGKVLGDRYELL